MSVARAHGALLFVAFAAGCGIRGDGIEESLSSNVAALNIPDDLPKPVQWDGSRIELFVADAWAACSAVADENTPSPTDVCSIIPAASHDLYMESVRQLMDTSATACQSLSPGYTVDENNCFFTPLANGNTLRHWVWTRKNADCNSFATSAGTSPKAAPLALERMPGVLSVIPFGPSQNTLEADDIVRTPGVNLCIAQRLRHLAPGTAGAATLTLSAADQRELLSITRDRAQMSILGYTRLARLLATKQPAVPPTTSLELAQDWFNNAAGPEFPTELGDDFAAAIQIHTLATTELLDLLARSASANVPWGAPSNTDSITLQFATGSWRDRALSLLYGGDPLAATTVATPWQHFPGTVPNVVNDTTVDHAAVDVREPQVDQLFQVLRRFDSIDLREAPNKAGKHEVDIQASANRIYRAAEAGIRTANCTAMQNGVCQLVAPEDVEDPSLGIANFLVWQNSRITLDHANTLAKLLADQVGYISDKQRNNIIYQVESGGSADVLGVKSILTRSGKDAGDYYHVDKDARLLQRSEPETYENKYWKKSIYIPTVIFPDADAQSQFFVDGGVFPSPIEGDRLAGAAKALTIVRHELFLADDDIAKAVPSANAALFFAHEKEIKNLIGGAVGASATVLEFAPQDFSKANDGTVTLSTPAQMRLTQYTATTDSFWSDNANRYALSFGADESGDFATTLMEDSSSKGFLSVDLQTVLGGASPIGNTILESRSTFAIRSEYTDLDVSLVRWEANITCATNGALGLEKQPSVSQGGGPSTYKLLLAHKLGSFPQAASPTGALNRASRHIVALQGTNPAQPRYDAFGYPTQFVPPGDVTLLGGAPGQSTLSNYLTNAKQAADAAVAAITIAFQTLLEEEKGQLSIDAQVSKSTQVMSAAQQSRCSQVDAKKCQADSTLIAIPLLNQTLRGNEASLHTLCQGNDDHAKLACAAYKIFHSYDVAVEIPNVVANKLSQAVQPTFADYSGGSLQTTFISAWADYRQLSDLMAQVYTGYGAADAKINAADTALNALQAEIKNDCSPAAFAVALLEGISVSAGFPSGGSVSMSMQPLLEAMKKCQDLSTGLAPAVSQVVLAAAIAINDMAEETMRAGAAASHLALDAAAGNQQAEQAKLAIEGAQLDIQLARISAPTTTALYRRYHSYDSWRALALLESARRYAVLARRAVEARYVVDLSTMSQPEPLVGPPSSWADQVYEYDLNMPSAVGVTIGPQQTTGSIYPNAIVDYVQNLQRFVDGYILARPTTSAQADSEVISLPGPSGLQGAGALPPNVIDSSSYRWDFFCQKTGSWVVNSSLSVDTVCGKDAPTQARMTFSLDPWGRVSGSVGTPPYQARYNSRWNRFAVNIVGTGILDCSKASDPLTCYTQAFIRYNLSQVGPSWITDFSEVWHPLNVERGQVEGAKALAAEEWLDPLANGWSKPFVAAVGRSEFADRPLGGTYELVLQLGPEVTLSHMERLQVLFESAYWVKQ